MEYKKQETNWMIQQINRLYLEQEIGLKQMMNQKEGMIIVTLDYYKVMIMSNICDYSDAYIFVKRIITVPITTAAGAAVRILIKKQHLKIVFHLVIA